MFYGVCIWISESGLRGGKDASRVRFQVCFPGSWYKAQLLSPAQPALPTLPLTTVVFYLQHLTKPFLNAFYPRLNVVWPLSFHVATSLTSSPFTRV